MASSGSIWVSLGLSTANFSKGISKAKGQLSGFQKGMAGLKGMFNPFTIGLGAVAALGAVVNDAVGIFSDFEKANSRLEAILGATSDQMESLSLNAQKLGSTTSFTASEVTELQTELAKLGFPTEDILKMTESTLDAAAALGSELGEQAATSGAVLKQYSLDASKASQVNDVMATAAASSALDFQKLSTALPIVGATAATAGVSFERTTALLGTLSDRGLDASSSGTALRNMFLELSKQGLTWDEAMEQINTSTDKNKTAMELFGKRGATASVIIAGTADATALLEGKLNDASGAAKKMADTMLDNLSGDITKASSAWEGFILSLEDGDGVINKSMRGITALGTSLLNLFTNLNNGDSALSSFKRHMDEVDAGFGLMSNSQVEFNANLEKNSAMVDVLKKQFIAKTITAKEYRAGIKALSEGFTALTTEQKQNNMIATKRANLTKVQAIENQKLIDSVAAATEEEKKNKESTVTLTAAQKKQKEEIASLSEGFSGYNSMLNASAMSALSSTKTINFLTAQIKALDNELNNVEIGSEAFTKIATEIEALQLQLDGKSVKLGIQPELKPIPEEEMLALATQEEMMQGVAQGMAGGVSNAFATMSDGMVESMGIADTASGRFTKSLASTAIKLIATNMATAMSNAITGATSSGAATGPGAVVSTPAFIASAISGIIGAFAAIPKFADGGLVFNDMIGMIGEGKGTTRSNPEVIAPLDKLKGFMPKDGGGMDGGEVKFRIEGDQLVGILKRQTKVNKFS